MSTTKESVEAERLLNAAIHAESYKDRVDARVKIVAALNERDKLRTALEACRYELLTLIPRVTPQYRANLQRTVELAKEALNDQKGE